MNGSLQRWDAESPALSRVYGRPLHGLHFKKGGTEGWWKASRDAKRDEEKRVEIERGLRVT